MDEKKPMTLIDFMVAMYGADPKELTKGMTDEEWEHIKKLIQETIPKERRQNGQEGTSQNDR